MSSASKAAANRSAHAIIKGYVYQFDKSIIEILDSGPGTRITIEGIEDIDINEPKPGAVIQCKYLASSKFSLPLIRSAILPMLTGYLSGKQIDYRLYIYCKDVNDIPNALSLDQLRKCLTERTRKGTIKHFESTPDSALTGFVSTFRIVAGQEFDEQRQLVHQKLVAALGGSIDDSADLYYGNALTIINDLAITPTIELRQITREQFIKLLNRRKAIYTRWHREYAGQDSFVRALRRRIKDERLLNTARRRLLVWEITTDDDVLPEQIGIIEALATRHFGQGLLDSAKPWTVIIVGSPLRTSVVKSHLIERGIAINDGYESISFNPDLFNTSPVINREGRSHLIALTSYSIRILSSDTYLAYLDHLSPPDTMLIMTDDKPSQFIPNSEPKPVVLHVQGLNTDHIGRLLEVR